MKSQIHLASVAIIFDDKKRVLLTQRFEPESLHSHGKWQFPGGTIEFGEHPRDTVIREVKEEVGIKIKLLTLHPIVYSHIFGKENIHVLIFGFPAKFISGNIDISSDSKTGDAKWFNYQKIDFNICLPLTKRIIDEAQAYLKNQHI